jgi:FkbM family methyltransferase
MEYYGQYGQDSVIKQFFDKKGIINGIFLDVGAHDGIRFSNTYILEKDGWEGVCVEAHPDYFKIMQSNRTSLCLNYAAGDKNEDNTVINLNYRGSLSSLDLSLESKFEKNYSGWYGDRSQSDIQNFRNGKHNIKMRTIDTILSESYKNTKINLVSIDIDGSEKYAFKGMDLKMWSPELFVCEYTVMGFDFIEEYAKINDYFFVRNVGEDSFFVKNEEDRDILNSISVSGQYIKVKHPLD